MNPLCTDTLSTDFTDIFSDLVMHDSNQPVLFKLLNRQLLFICVLHFDCVVL